MTYGTSKALTANAFARTGYTFNGWNTKADGTGTQYANKQNVNNLTTANGSKINMYAQWKPISYTITFNGNGATSGSMPAMSMAYGTAKNLAANVFTRSGYAFSKWTTNANGTGTAYANGQSVSNLTTTNSTNIVLYAQWTPVGRSGSVSGGNAGGGLCRTG